MEFLPLKEKMKCACCRKSIPLSKVFMLFKEVEMIEGKEEITYKHFCGFCHMYISKIRETVIEEIRNRLLKY